MIKDLTEAWMGLVVEMAYTPSSRPFIQERKVSQAKTWVIPGEVWRAGHRFTFESMGYQGGKMRQLKRNYWNPEVLAATKEKLDSRIAEKKDVTSVSAIMQYGAKSARSQGFCMQSVVITYFKGNTQRPPEITVDMMYRSTEVIQKFSADLLFLHQELLPYLLGDHMVYLKEVRFYFCNIFLSPLFLPVLYNFLDPIIFLKMVKEGDPTFQYKTLFRTKSPLEHEAGYFSFRTRNAMHNIFLQLIDQGKVNRLSLGNYIEKELKERAGTKK